MTDTSPTGSATTLIEASSASPFPGVVFSNAISLGGNCETAHWLRAYGRYAVHGPFDWLVTPLNALPVILEEDGARLGTSFALANAGTSVRCKAYGVLYHHEFPRGTGNAVLFDSLATVACRNKLAHKWATLVEACARASASGLPILFLRLGDSSGVWPRTVDLNAVTSALAARFPELDFRLLVLLPIPAPGATIAAPDPFVTLDPRVEVRGLSRGTDPVWTTDKSTWRGLLTALRFEGPAAATVLGETLHWSGEADEPSFFPS